VRRILAFVSTLVLVAPPSHGQATAALVRLEAIQLPGVEGRIDHLAIDVARRRLFVAALGNDSVEVVDLASSRVIRSIRGLAEPQGAYYDADSDRLYVTNAGSGRCDVFGGASFGLIAQIELGNDADNIHGDPRSHQVLIAAGDGISVVDTTTDRRVAEMGLPGHPEGFALDPRGSLLFANVPAPARSVFVLDRVRDAVIKRWPLGGPFANALSNFPMSLDDEHRRLFVATRTPAALKVLDADNGRAVAAVGIDRDADDIFYDSRRRSLYVSCGGGFVDVVEQADPDHYRVAARVPTADGARTSLWVPEMDRLFVAVPRHGDSEAEILVLAPQ
jgi:DNA-binding beta-propeller fold protein YncE